VTFVNRLLLPFRKGGPAIAALAFFGTAPPAAARGILDHRFPLPLAGNAPFVPVKIPPLFARRLRLKEHPFIVRA
jgi:hypothetical protein